MQIYWAAFYIFYTLPLVLFIFLLFLLGFCAENITFASETWSFGHALRTRRPPFRPQRGDNPVCYQ